MKFCFWLNVFAALFNLVVLGVNISLGSWDFVAINAACALVNSFLAAFLYDDAFN